MRIAKKDFFPQVGERALVVGKTGSGKTAFSLWLMEQMPQSPIILYDTKEEAKFPKLPNSIVVYDVKSVNEAIDNHSVDYIVFRPPLEIATDPEMMDALLLHHYNNYKGIGAYIDELYTFHKGGRSGPGLVALLTRGRSRGITLIGCTQRPAWISRFCITEADKYYLFSLVDKKDRKTLSDVVPDFDKERSAERHWFYFFEPSMEHAYYCKPIPLKKELDTGYSDGDTTTSESITSRFIWL